MIYELFALVIHTLYPRGAEAGQGKEPALPRSLCFHWMPDFDVRPPSLTTNPRICGYELTTDTSLAFHN